MKALTIQNPLSQKALLSYIFTSVVFMSNSNSDGFTGLLGPCK